MKKYYSLLLLSTVLASNTAFAAATDTTFSVKPFTDVPTSSPYFEAIEFLRTNNVVKGYLDGTFKPTSRVSRGELVKFVVNPFIMDTGRINECLLTHTTLDSDTVIFPDVHKSDAFAVEVCFAKIKGVIDGYPDGRFHPTGSITFVEVAKVLANVFSFQTPTEDQSAKWYVPYVQRLSDLHAIPTSITRLTQTVTRAQIAEMTFRLKTGNTTKASTTLANLKQ